MTSDNSALMARAGMTGTRKSKALKAELKEAIEKEQLNVDPQKAKI